MKKWLSMLLVAVLLVAPLNGIAAFDASLPTFDTWEDAADYLRSRTWTRERVVRFNLSEQDAMPLWEEDLREEFCLMEPLVSRLHARFLYSEWGMTVEIWPIYRAGVRMLDAWESGDVSALSPQEQAALVEAKAIVAWLKTQYTTPLELERGIVDELCARLTYMDAPPTPPTEDAPGVSAAYALTYGQANCQGYSDAFYLLAGIAGFEVGLQNGYMNEETHTWNTVKIDGEWYVVDVTDADTSSDAIAPEMGAYRLFNAGRDRCRGILFWPPAWETADIAGASGSSYFFQAELPGFGVTCKDLDEMARHCYQRACEGERDVWVLLTGHGAELSAKDIAPAMKRVTSQHNGAAQWTFWSWPCGSAQCILLRWTEFDPVEKFGNAELSEYLGESLRGLVGSMEGMKKIDATDAVRYSNGTVAVSAPLDEDRVTFIGLMRASDYRICDVAVGQSLKEALALLEKAGWILTDRQGARGDLQNSEGNILSIWSKKGDTVDRVAISLGDEGPAD